MVPLNPASTALIFPGRRSLLGRYDPRHLMGASHIAAQTIEYADDRLEADFSTILLSESRLAFSSPHNWNLALFINQIALLRIFYESLDGPFEPLVVAGIDAGEVTAMTAAGSLSFQDALRLLRARAAAIEASESGFTVAEMLVTGLTAQELRDLSASSGIDGAGLTITATLNTRSHCLSGSSESLSGIKEAIDANEGSASSLPLPSLAGGDRLTAALPIFSAALEAVPIHKSLLRLISSTTGKAVFRPDELRSTAIAALNQPARYDLLLAALRAEGVSDIVAFGSDLCLNSGVAAAGLRLYRLETIEDIIHFARKGPSG